MHEVAALVTRPPKRLRGGRVPPPTAIQEAGRTAQLPVLMPESVNSDEAIAELKPFQADLYVVCDYGQILSAEILSLTRLGGINLHASLLPRYRGAAPINWALYNGDRETGVTVIHMTPRLDAGPCLETRHVAIDDQETAIELEQRLAVLGVEPVMDAIGQLSRWDGQSPIGNPQRSAEATRAPRLKKDHGKIDWTRGAVEIVNQVRAMQPWPGTFTEWIKQDGTEQRLIIRKAARVDLAVPTSEPPGQVLVADGKQLIVATGSDALRIDEIQAAGKRPMQVDEFLRGMKLTAGARLGFAANH